MDKVRFEHLTRANVLQIGLAFVALGAIGYLSFRYMGLEGQSAGMASEVILVVILFAWTATYLLRVFTGKMTFNEQRKRYREAYEKITTDELRTRFEMMTEEEQIRLLNEVESEKNGTMSSPD